MRSTWSRTGWGGRSDPSGYTSVVVLFSKGICMAIILLQHQLNKLDLVHGLFTEHDLVVVVHPLHRPSRLGTSKHLVGAQTLVDHRQELGEIDDPVHTEGRGEDVVQARFEQLESGTRRSEGGSSVVNQTVAHLCALRSPPSICSCSSSISANARASAPSMSMSSSAESWRTSRRWLGPA